MENRSVVIIYVYIYIFFYNIYIALFTTKSVRIQPNIVNLVDIGHLCCVIPQNARVYRSCRIRSCFVPVDASGTRVSFPMALAMWKAFYNSELALGAGSRVAGARRDTAFQFFPSQLAFTEDASRIASSLHLCLDADRNANVLVETIVTILEAIGDS